MPTFLQRRLRAVHRLPALRTGQPAADADDVGAASGVNNSISRIGNLVAIAALGIVIAAAGDGALPAAAHLEGFQHAMLRAAAMSLLAALVAIRFPPRPASLSG